MQKCNAWPPERPHLPQRPGYRPRASAPRRHRPTSGLGAALSRLRIPVACPHWLATHAHTQCRVLRQYALAASPWHMPPFLPALISLWRSKHRSPQSDQTRRPQRTARTVGAVTNAGHGQTAGPKVSKRQLARGRLLSAGARPEGMVWQPKGCWIPTGHHPTALHVALPRRIDSPPAAAPGLAILEHTPAEPKHAAAHSRLPFTHLHDAPPTHMRTQRPALGWMHLPPLMEVQ